MFGRPLALLRYLLLLCLPAIPAMAQDGSAVRQPGDLVVYNGSIFTSDPALPWVEAFAVKNGHIVARGTSAEIKRWVGPATEAIDLAGQMAMPGLNDAHTHVEWAARELLLYSCQISPYADLDQLIAAVKTCADGKGRDEWIVGQYVSSGLFPQLKQESALKRLDAASGGRPVFLRNDTTHDRWVNSSALRLAGYTPQTPDPKNGIIGRDGATGRLTGILIERPAFEPVEKLIPQAAKPNFEARVKALRFGVQTLNKMGVTAFQDARVGAEEVELYHELDRRGGLSARANISILVEPAAAIDFDKLFVRRKDYRSDHLSLDWAKIYVDGVMVTRTSLFLEPYLPDKEHGDHFLGKSRMSAEALAAMVTELDRRRIGVKLHVTGDGSVRIALDAIAQARKVNGDSGVIHTLAHPGFVSPDDLPRFKKLRAAIEASPTVWYPSPVLAATVPILGAERTESFWPFKDMLASGALVAGGTDWKTLPAEYCDLWSGIEGMVTRRNPKGYIEGQLGAAQAISLEQALQIYTMGSARAMGIADRTGSIEVGKSADFLILARNIFNAPADDLSETVVKATFLEGRRIS